MGILHPRSWAREQDLRGRTGGLSAEKASRKDLGLVDDQHITGLQEPGEVPEAPVQERPLPWHDQEPTLVPSIRGIPRDAIRRQGVVVVGDAGSIGKACHQESCAVPESARGRMWGQSSPKRVP